MKLLNRLSQALLEASMTLSLFVIGSAIGAVLAFALLGLALPAAALAGAAGFAGVVGLAAVNR